MLASRNIKLFIGILAGNRPTVGFNFCFGPFKIGEEFDGVTRFALVLIEERGLGKIGG